MILRQEHGRTHVYRRVDFSGTADLDLIREKLVVGPAEYKPHLDRVNFVSRG